MHRYTQAALAASASGCVLCGLVSRALCRAACRRPVALFLLVTTISLSVLEWIFLRMVWGINKNRPEEMPDFECVLACHEILLFYHYLLNILLVIRTIAYIKREGTKPRCLHIDPRLRCKVKLFAHPPDFNSRGLNQSPR